MKVIDIPLYGVWNGMKQRCCNPIEAVTIPTRKGNYGHAH